jgi:hypothetical protein
MYCHPRQTQTTKVQEITHFFKEMPRARGDRARFGHGVTFRVLHLAGLTAVELFENLL